MALSLKNYEDGTSEKLSKEEWVVTEKVHGANFSCHTDGKECRYARRRDFLKENEGFYDFKKADFMTDFSAKVLDIFQRVKEIVNDGEIFHVIVYGELFGGKCRWCVLSNHKICITLENYGVSGQVAYTVPD